MNELSKESLRMKHKVTLTITSLLSILLFSLHWADEISRGMIKRLFDTEENVKELIKWKELYARLEETADRCEDVANIIEGIVLKHA